jgi:hypothetical protein
MVVLLNIQGKCAHLRAKTVDISGHLPSDASHGQLSSWESARDQPAKLSPSRRRRKRPCWYDARYVSPVAAIKESHVQVYSALTTRIYNDWYQQTRKDGGFSLYQWLSCSLFAPSAHSSPQNLLALHLIYQLPAKGRARFTSKGRFCGQ